jgi:hypothetical protein
MVFISKLFKSPETKGKWQIAKLMNTYPELRDMKILLYGEEGLDKVTLFLAHRFLPPRIPDLYDGM